VKLTGLKTAFAYWQQSYKTGVEVPRNARSVDKEMPLDQEQLIQGFSSEFSGRQGLNQLQQSCNLFKQKRLLNARKSPQLKLITNDS